MSSITETEVRRLARLARLHLAPDEVALFARQLRDILEFARQVQAVPTGHADAASHPAATLLREDIVQPSLAPDQALANAAGADTSPGLFKVPRVLND